MLFPNPIRAKTGVLLPRNEQTQEQKSGAGRQREFLIYV